MAVALPAAPRRTAGLLAGVLAAVLAVPAAPAGGGADGARAGGAKATGTDPATTTRTGLAGGLADRVRAPLLYVAHSGGGGDAGRWPWRLLEQEATAASLGLDASLRQMLQAVGNLARDGDVELALTSIDRLANGRPNLVFRAVVHRPRQVLDTLLRDRLRAEADGTVGEAQPALKLRGMHLALLGDGRGSELIVANDRDLLGELFDDSRRTVAGGTPVLSRDPAFTRMRDALDLPAGGLLVYADWPRLRRHTGPVFPGTLWPVFWSSGLAATQRVAIGMRPRDAGLCSTLLLDTEGGDLGGHPGRFGGLQGPSRDGPSGDGASASASRRTVVRDGRRGPPGWISLIEPAPLGALIKGLAHGEGVASLTLAVEPGRLLDGARRSEVGSLLFALQGGCARIGLDLENHVLDRLGTGAGLQVLTGIGDGASVAYRLQAKNSNDARRLFRDVSRALASTRLAEVDETDADAGRARFRVRSFGRDLHVAVDRDALVFAEDPAALEAAVRGGDRGDRDAWGSLFRELVASLDEDGRAGSRWAHRPVAGIVTVDLGAPAGDAPRGVLHGKHVGIVQLDGSTVRCDLFTEFGE